MSMLGSIWILFCELQMLARSATLSFAYCKNDVTPSLLICPKSTDFVVWIITCWHRSSLMISGLPSGLASPSGSVWRDWNLRNQPPQTHGMSHYMLLLTVVWMPSSACGMIGSCFFLAILWVSLRWCSWYTCRDKTLPHTVPTPSTSCFDKLHE